MINTIINADCMDILVNMGDNEVDLVLTDPPYGINMAKNGKVGKSKDYGKQAWDSAIPDREVFEQIIRVSKNQIIFGGNYFTNYLTNSPCWLVWDKNNRDTTFADCELVWTSFPTAVRKIKYTWNGYHQQPGVKKEKRVHPTQKPVGVLEWVLENYTEAGQLILDPFLGSGSTAVACLKKKRRFIGIEKEAHYCGLAEKRISTYQLTLF